MAIEITMPKLSDTMEEGTILKWKVREGDRVSQGDIIAEVETDKAAMEMEAFEAGTVGSLKVEEGQTVSVGTVIAVLETQGKMEEKAASPQEDKPRESGEEKAGEKEKAAKKEREEERTEEKKAQEKKAEEKKAEEKKAEEKPSAPKEEAPAREKERENESRGRQKEQAPAARRPPSGPSTLDIIASPAARRQAQDQGIDLSQVRGTGPGGRIVVADVERTLNEHKAPKRELPVRREPAKRERSVKIRRIVANKMVESWQNIPHFFVTVAVDMSEVIRIRKEMGVSINDFIIAATARSLQEHPWVNSAWGDAEAVEQEKINISLAVATDRGLYNPVLHDCGHLSLKELSHQARELGEKAHAGRLGPKDMEGGTFTISNMGMLGVESFSAIITPPQAAVLAVGTVKGEAVVDDQGEPGVATIVRLTLSADHRILDGADAAEFMATLKSYLEAPVTLTNGNYGKGKE